ncbi:hypothetical protein ABMA27_008948 [Loxostege sticticalis]|uniref:THAP-type domain-containing protein n=1 Tax=Loxostege sticticalis TaxID=481309 RepID=A0ABR3H9R1_LOXSC
MNSKGYKWCAVPQCTNTSLKTPNKVFIYVPNDKTMRYKWLTLARCHMIWIINYMEYHIMGSVSKIRMKPGCIPTKFECQADRRKRASDITERPTLKKQRHITQEKNKTANKSIQVYITHKFRSKAVQTQVNFINQMTSPLKPDRQSVSLHRHLR